MSTTLVVDAGFCHGSACLAHMFNRPYYMTGRQIFKEASIYWLKRTLILGRNSSASPTGYIFHIKADEWGANDELLTGLAGLPQHYFHL